MDNSFRLATLEQIAKNAGILTSLVQNSTGSSGIKFKAIGSVGPGTTVMIPENPIKADGSVDIVINIRGIAGGDVKTASSLGVNAIVVSAEAGGMGSKENVQQFGNSNFINHTVSTIIGNLQKQFPEKNVHRGKLIVSGFSGGGGAVAQMLTERNKVDGGIDAVIINDGLHSNPGTASMNAVVDYAKEAAENPDKYQFHLIHTAVDPGKYISTTHTADYLLNQLDMNRTAPGDWEGVGKAPASVASKGGVKVTQLYDTQQPYMAKDESGVVRPNVKGKTSGGQHISSLDWMPNAFKQLNLHK